MILEALSLGPMQVNCYILASVEDSPAIIIDPGADFRKIKEALDNHKLKPAFVINTHGHYDHIGCDDKFKVPVYIHSKDLAMLENPKLNLSAFFALPYRVGSEIRPLEDSQIIGLDDLQLKVLHIPGHTPGGIALQLIKPAENKVFTGDTLFCGGIGRSDLEGGDEVLLIGTIKKKLLTLSPDTMVYPGHGSSTTIEEERKNNPFITSSDS